MLTKTQIITEEKNDQLNGHSFSIPENIKKDINEKGFHLYNWIGEKDVKESIERDFLVIINKFGLIGAIILIVPAVILILTGNPLSFIIFGLSLGLINFLFLIYLLFLSIKRTSILRKNAYVLITDTSISINGNINKLDNQNIIIDKNIKNISMLFEEEIFKESKIKETKKGFTKQVFKKLGEGYGNILNIGKGNSKDSGNVVLILLALYTIYALSLGIIYFIGILFIWIFGILISIINKQILLKTGHEITTINNDFENIDEYSKRLVNRKDDLSSLLKSAINNDWKDSLLEKINSGIKDINTNAGNAINISIELKDRIEKSKYKEMFNFSIYNSWIKKQILIPLEQISELLKTNLEKLNQNKIDIEKQISETIDDSYKGPLIASKTRTEMRINDIQKHIDGIEIYINKLK